MRALGVVFRREIEERRLLFVAALLLGLVPVLLPFVPGFDSGHASDLRQAAAAGLMMIATLALAVLLGATGIAGDLMAGRMSFYFSRPLPSWSIWAGKLSAMLALVVAVAGLIALPTLLVDGLAAAGPFSPGGGLGLGPGTGSFLSWTFTVVLVLLASHFLAVSIRSRSPWLALDLVGLLVTVGVVSSVWRGCRREGLWYVGVVPGSSGPVLSVLSWLVLGFGGALLLALLLGGALQVARGRIDPRRGHRVQSLVLWSVTALALLGMTGAARWAVAVTPEDLTQVQLVQSAPAGPWLALLGPVRHRPGFEAMLLVDPESGRFVRTRAALSLSRVPEIRFSADGRLAYWFEPQDGLGSPLELMTQDLIDPAARPRPSGAVFAPGATGNHLDFLLSPDGRRLAVFLDCRLTVEDLATHALLVAQEIDREDAYYSRTLQFTGPDRLRLDVLNQYQSAAPDPILQSPVADGVLQRGKAHVSFYEADLATGRVALTGNIDSDLGAAWWHRSPDGERGVLLGRESSEVRDGRSGALLSTLPGRTYLARFVAGGLVLMQRTEGGREILLYDRDGRQLRARLALPGRGLTTVQDGLAGADPLQIFARPLQGGSAKAEGAVWKRWRIAVDRGAFEPLPDRLLYLIGGGTPWNPAALRRADGSITFSLYRDQVRVRLHPGR